MHLFLPLFLPLPSTKMHPEIALSSIFILSPFKGLANSIIPLFSGLSTALSAIFPIFPSRSNDETHQHTSNSFIYKWVAYVCVCGYVCFLYGVLLSCFTIPGLAIWNDIRLPVRILLGMFRWLLAGVPANTDGCYITRLTLPNLNT